MSGNDLRCATCGTHHHPAEDCAGADVPRCDCGGKAELDEGFWFCTVEGCDASWEDCAGAGYPSPEDAAGWLEESGWHPPSIVNRRTPCAGQDTWPPDIMLAEYAAHVLAQQEARLEAVLRWAANECWGAGYNARNGAHTLGMKREADAAVDEALRRLREEE